MYVLVSISNDFTDPPPPVPSINLIKGSLYSFANCSAIICFWAIDASAAPPLTVKSSPPTTTFLPLMVPLPITKLDGIKFLSSPFSSYSALPDILPISWNEFLSKSKFILSLTLSLLLSFWRFSFSLPPIFSARDSLFLNSSISFFQLIIFINPF